MIKKFSKHALGVMVALGFMVTSAYAVEWSMAAPWGGGPLLEEDAKGFAKNVELLTEGRIKIRVFPGGTLGSPLKVTETVKTGVAEAGHNWPGYDWGIDKTAVLFGGYAGSMGPERSIQWFYQGGGIELYRQWRLEKFGVIGIPCAFSSTELFLHSRKPVRSLADFKGLKIRTAGAWAEIAQKLGASTVILPGAEVYAALERGVVDATEWSSPSVNLSAGFHKVAKYIVIPGIHQPYAMVECEINKKAWGGLSNRDKTLVQLAGKITALDAWMRYADKDADAFNSFLKFGNKIVELDADFVAKARQATVEWANKQAKKNKWFAKVMAHQQAYQRKLKDQGRYRVR